MEILRMIVVSNAGWSSRAGKWPAPTHCELGGLSGVGEVELGHPVGKVKPKDTILAGDDAEKVHGGRRKSAPIVGKHNKIATSDHPVPVPSRYTEK